MPPYPERIVCLTAETAETLYLIGAGDRVVGRSVDAVRPAAVRDTPSVGGYRTARLDRIVALRPDLVLAFSDLQAELVAALVKRGYAVVTFNQRSVDGILQMIRMVGGLVGRGAEAGHLCGNLEQGLTAMRLAAGRLPRRPRVFVEEWDDPIISGIGWVDELVTIAGGEPIFPDLAAASLAKDRIVTAEAVREAGPDVILAAWCGKRVLIDRILQRPGWTDIPAVARGAVYEIPAAAVLQPGPVALTQGVRHIYARLCEAAGIPLEPALAPEGWGEL